MKMIRAIVRPEKGDLILDKLLEAGYPSVTKCDVYGRGKQKGLHRGNLYYGELPRYMLVMVIKDEDEENIVKIITENARTGEGNYGDGRIFVTPVLRAYTISTKAEGL